MWRGWVRLGCLWLMAGCAATAEMSVPEAGEGDRRDAEKLDAFYGDYGSVLVNDALGNLTYGNCEEDASFDLFRYLHVRGLDRDEEEARFAAEVRLAAFRQVLALRAAVHYLRADGTDAAIELPDGYLALPDIERYRAFAEGLQEALDLQRDLRDGAESLSMSWTASIEAVHEHVADIEQQLRALDYVVPHGEVERDRRALEEQLLVYLRIVQALDPDPGLRRAAFQNQLKAAAFELGVLQRIDDLTTPGAVKRAAIWPNAIDPYRLLTAKERISQIYAQFPLLAADDSLLHTRDLAERLWPLVSPDRSAHDWAEALESHAMGASDPLAHGVDDVAIRNAAREFFQVQMVPRMEALAVADIDGEVQRQFDWAFDHWLAAIDQRLASLPEMDSGELLAYPELVDAALVTADRTRQPLWLALYCRSEYGERLAEIGKTVTFVGGGIIAMVAGLLGQVEIAVPLGAALAIAGMADAVGSLTKAARYADAQLLFWVSHDRLRAQEREAIVSLVFATLGVAAEAASAAHLLRSWRMLQGIKGRLGYLAREHELAQQLLSTARADFEAAAISGTQGERVAPDLAAAIERAARRSVSTSEVSKIAARTLRVVEEAEGSMGPMEMAFLIGRFPSEAQAVAFFEAIGRSEGGFSDVARQGYRAWLRMVQRAAEDGGDIRLPTQCL